MGRPRSANATAVEDSRLAVLSRDHLFSFIRTHTQRVAGNADRAGASVAPDR